MTSLPTPSAPAAAAALDDPTATMSGVVQRGYGDADVLATARVDVPRPTGEQVLVRVQAAGLDAGTWHLMTGTPYLVRLVTGLRAPRQPIIGRDVAGTVVAVGPAVTEVAVGDEVFGITSGSCAEYAVVSTDKLAAKPAELSFDQAAVLGISGTTALRAVVDAGRVRPGDRVLVMGASGGVGSFAVQIAVAQGAEVTGVCSAAKADHVRSLGATRVLDHARDDALDGSVRYDVIIDIGGRSPVRRLRRALTPRGTLVLVGGEGGGPLTGGIGRQVRAALRSLVVRQRLVMLTPRESAADLRRLAAMVEAGDVRPVVDATFPLAETPDAMRRLAAGTVRGKLAIQVAE